jgi:small-conductance mechanosensitive channel
MELLFTYIERLLAYLHINSTYVLWGNTMHEYVLAIIVLILSLVVFGLAQYLVLAWLSAIARRTTIDLDDTVIKMIRSVHPPLYVVLALWLTVQTLTLTGVAHAVVAALLVVWFVYQAVTIAGIIVEDVIFHHFAKDHDETVQSAIHLIANIAKGMMWVFGILLALSNFGVNVTSLVAGAGIAGVAIAFALQGILGDLFSSFSLYFDRPFKIGDFIVVDDIMGSVKRIGVKTTRLQSLSGEEIVMSNKELTGVRIRNYKRMEERRVLFTFRIAYDTPTVKVRQIPAVVQDIVSIIPLTRFDRAHFKSFGESSLDFEVVYFLTDTDYNTYMDIQQEINLALMEYVEREGIRFAYPTRTLKFDAADVVTVRTRE